MNSRLIAMLLLSGFCATHMDDTQACAMFTVTSGDRVLMGNSEDFIKPGYIWFLPAKKNRYGRVNVGFSDKFAQGSMNDQGLSFDAAVTPDVRYVPDPNKETPKNIIENIMNECATVDEAIEYFRRYNSSHLSRSQFMFVDKSGASVVIAWLPGKGLSVVRKSGPYQLITNSRLEESAFRCERFVLAERTLNELDADPFDSIRNALANVHQRGPQAFTSYSNIFDLTRGEVIVYNLADFDESITFNLDEELSKRKRTYELAKIFTNGDRLSEMRGSQPRSYDTVVVVPNETLNRYAGTYVANGGVTKFTLKVQGEGLMLTFGASEERHLYPESDALFRVREGGQIAFDMDDAENVKGFTIRTPVMERYVTKTP